MGSESGGYAFGDAIYDGSAPGIGVHVSNIVGIAPMFGGAGYWLVGSDGGVYAFGRAAFFGSLPGLGVQMGNVAATAST